MDRDENQTDPSTAIILFNFPVFFFASIISYYYHLLLSYICVNLFFNYFFI